MMRVLTDIYPADVKPARDGWYLAGASQISTCLRLFCDGEWHFESGNVCTVQALLWRGLAFDPTAAVLCLDRATDLPGVFVPGATC